MSSAEIAKVFDFVSESDVQIHSLLLIRHGYLVLEAYFFPSNADTLHDICSCTKSISSTLIGMAIDQGKIRSVEEKLTDLLPGRRLGNDVAAKRRITLENVLTMTTGMDYPRLGEPRLAPMRRAGGHQGGMDWEEDVRVLLQRVHRGQTDACEGNVRR